METPPATETATATVAPSLHSAEDLAEIIRAYNDVTERLQASHERLQNEVLRLRQELASTNAQLQRSKRLSALGEMAAGIAHEIRNPLAAIQLYVSMIVEDLEAPQPAVAPAAESARKVSAAVRGLNAIVTDVLTFAKETTPRKQRLAVTALFDRAVDAHRPALEAAQVGVLRDEEAEAGVAIEGDPNLLHQAVLNLVRNAVEAMAGRESHRVLSLLVATAGAEATLTVRDTGPGIAEEDIDRIFNPFFTTRNTGTGLGLAIVHRIVDAHGGTIEAGNDPRTGGAVFRLTLARAAEATDNDGASA